MKTPIVEEEMPRLMTMLQLVDERGRTAMIRTSGVRTPVGDEREGVKVVGWNRRA